MVSTVLNWPLESGPLSIILRIAAVAALLTLLWLVVTARRRAWLKAVTLAGCLALATLTAIVGVYMARNVWMLFPDRLEPDAYLWIVVGLFALSVAIVAVNFNSAPSRAVASLVAAVVVVAACANQINASYAAYPTLADALGTAQFDQIKLKDVNGSARRLPELDSVAATWTPPPTLRSTGELTSAPIPAPVSGFVARNAEIYLPPAYFADPRPQLPVLVLLAGQPGTPRDWLGAGQLERTMNNFAAAHKGLAPVVVVPDGTGGEFADPLCLDSRLGNVDSYLARDVPTWIKSNLTVGIEPRHWAVGGLSYGGTCALQLAMNHPDVYSTFLDISGAAEPSLGDRTRTVAAAFGGDQNAFTRVNPLNLLRTHQYPGSAAAIVVGVDDHETLGDARNLYSAVLAAGIKARYDELPGGHDWHVFASGLALELPWVAQQIGLI